jgi:hypothetical protein
MVGAREPAKPGGARMRPLRFIVLAAALASVVAGLLGGLVRLGIPLHATSIAERHGALMVCGFLGTAISLERAVAISRGWAYAAPLCCAVGAVMLIVSTPWLAGCAFLLASLALIGNSLVIFHRQPAVYTAVLVVAAACWGAGTLAFTSGGANGTGFWLAFLVLTIAAERLELSRVLAPPRSAQVVFVLGAALFLIGVARGELTAQTAPFSGVGLIAITTWLLRYDMAWRMLKRPGQPRFTAVCLIAGYFWLGVAGTVLVFMSPRGAVFSYDATVHAITIGFVISMIFGHAPLILPALTGVRIRIDRLTYAPLALLHASLVLRIAADFFEWIDVRAASGPLTIVALLGYAGVLAFVSRKNRPAW